MWGSVVVSAILLLLLFHLFSFIFYCETTVQASVATLWNIWLLQNKFNVHVRHEKSSGVCTILMTKFVLHALYTDLHVCVKSEVYFEL